MFKSKNGKTYGSHFVARRHDQAVAEPRRKEDAEPKVHASKEHGKHDVKDKVQTPKEVVQEHGPAKNITIEHDHEGGKHTVESEHEDGHVHDAEFASPEEAHEHAKDVASFEKDEQGVDKETDSAEQGGTPFDFEDVA